MPKTVHGVAGKKLPLWVKLISSATGILFAGFGMSSFISGGSMSSVIIPIFVGAVMIYLTGYERRMYIDEKGVSKETSFWGQKKIQSVPWDEINDARIILNKGKKIYVIFHGNMSIWPFTFLSEQKESLIETVTEYLGEEDIFIEI
ncbi:MAG: hypothetical protein GX672_04225 [Synergistaceae bacterium]|nr:hypothetical protein [Synergistaceae bacterium]